MTLIPEILCQSAEKEREYFEKMIKDLRDSEAKLLALLEDPIYDEESAEASNLDAQIVEVIVLH